MTTEPILYGVPFSQPVRAVMWLMIYKRLPFELVLINPGSKGSSGSRHPDYLAKNPAGTIPTLEEPDTGFTLGEAHAIMTYLCDKHAWHDVYPFTTPKGERIPDGPDTRFRGNVFALTTANRRERIEIGPRTLVPRWSGERMDDAMAVDGLICRE
ncbi:MAG: glutathione S-transferase N-terminal domain-containing protein [Proteobacteria bacterium]|nr:glutathione S-transferase N-terminal domain-containing protein [Pseudomonadota bacterium]